MDRAKIEEAIEFHRKIAAKEIQNEKIVNGLLVGPKESQNKELHLNDFINPERSFFSKDVGGDIDQAYVTAFRLGHFNVPSEISKASRGASFVGGMDLGSQLVKDGLVKDLDSLKILMANQKLGILDIFSEETTDNHKKMDIRVYECIECAGLPNIEEPVCFFEAGLITGILKEILNKPVNAHEKRCWTNGYSFCQFDVIIDEE